MREIAAAAWREGVRHLRPRRHAVDDNALVAPVELVGLAWRKGERRVGFRRLLGTAPLERPSIAAHRVVAALIAVEPQHLVDPLEREALARALAAFSMSIASKRAANGTIYGSGCSRRR